MASLLENEDLHTEIRLRSATVQMKKGKKNKAKQKK